MKTQILKLSPISILILTSILSFSSCKKKAEIIPAPTSQNPEVFTSLNSYLQTRKPISQTFLVNATTGGVFTTNKGSKITVPANAFLTHTGQVVSGMVSLKIKEIFTNANMIFSGVFPISDGNLLNSGGEFFLQATQNGELLRVANGVFIGLDIPAQAFDNQMELFFAGVEEEMDTANWNLINDTIGQGPVWSNSSFTFNSSDNSYQIQLDTLCWGNIDAFDYTINYFNCNFNLSGVTGLNNTNTTAFAVFKNKNTVWPVGVSGWGTISGNTINETHLGSIPLNLVVISVVGGQLYYGLLDITPQPSTTYTVLMQTTTSSNLDQIIANLP